MTEELKTAGKNLLKAFPFVVLALFSADYVYDTILGIGPVVASIMVLITIAAWVALAWFPLIRELFNMIKKKK